MTQEYLSNLTREQLETQLKYADGYITSLNKENDEIRTENKALKQCIKDMEDACGGSCFSNYEDLPFGDDGDEREKLIAELQDRLQQDCIRINDLTTTVHVLAGLYSTLRKNVGMD